MEIKQKIYSVRELNNEIKNVLKINYNGKIKIEGEISNYKISNRNLFFTLKDEMSKLDIIFWGYMDNFINDENVNELENGKQVIVTGRLTCWEKQGSYQITANKVEIQGIGDLHTEFLKIKEKYNKAGYFDIEIKKQLKEHIKKIGVITALGGAALKDFLYVLEKNNFDGEIFIKGCTVQGNDCPKTVANSIAELDKIGLDVIVITRGGGSYEDLFGFSHPQIIKAIYKANTCIISAVGHEVDTMLSDYVADIRAPTPSVAGEVIALHQKDKTNIDAILKIKDKLNMDIFTSLHQYQTLIQDMDNLIEDPINIIDNYYEQFDKYLFGLQNELTSILNESLIELKETNFMINSNNPKEILKNGYVMLVDADTNKMIKSGIDLSLLKDLSDIENTDKKLKLIFNDKTIIISFDKLYIL